MLDARVITVCMQYVKIVKTEQKANGCWHFT